MTTARLIRRRLALLLERGRALTEIEIERAGLAGAGFARNISVYSIDGPANFMARRPPLPRRKAGLSSTDNGNAIRAWLPSPMVGTVYWAPEARRQTVSSKSARKYRPGRRLLIIEAMKNDVKTRFPSAARRHP